MKFMFIMRATEEAMEAARGVPIEEMFNRMGAYNEELMKIGALVAAEGLAPADEGFVVDFLEGGPIVADGAYYGTREQFDGFWLVRLASKEEALEWAKRCPLGPGMKLEVRRVQELEDFTEFADNEYFQKEAQWRKERGLA
jgi:hypothetical protein